MAGEKERFVLPAGGMAIGQAPTTMVYGLGIALLLMFFLYRK